MKRIMAWMLTMIVALSASFTAFAAESNLDGETGRPTLAYTPGIMTTRNGIRFLWTITVGEPLHCPTER